LSVRIRDYCSDADIERGGKSFGHVVEQPDGGKNDIALVLASDSLTRSKFGYLTGKTS